MRLSTLRISTLLPNATLLLASVIWAGGGSMAYAHGGGGGGHGGGMGGGHMGGGHMGGGHMGGGHMGGMGGGHMGGMGGGYHHHGYGGGGYYGGFFPGYFGFGLGGLGYNGFGYGLGYNGLGYGLGYGGYGSNYMYSPYSSYGYGTGGYGYPGYTYSRMYGYPAGTTGSTVVARTNGPFLGINEQPVADANGTGMQVMNVYAGSAAERAGLKVGDVIHSINGYNTQTFGNITWIIQNAAPNGTLNMNVRHAGAASDVVVVASVR